MWKSKNNFLELVLCFHHRFWESNSGYQTRVATIFFLINIISLDVVLEISAFLHKGRFVCSLLLQFIYWEFSAWIHWSMVTSPCYFPLPMPLCPLHKVSFVSPLCHCLSLSVSRSSSLPLSLPNLLPPSSISTPHICGSLLSS